MDAYDLHEARFVQSRNVTSAANADSIILTAVPPGKVWTIIGSLYYPSVNETQYVSWSITSGGVAFPVTVPVNINLYPWAFPLVTEGMELKLYPGEYLLIQRGGHTLGSTMFAAIRYIESDLPFYAYEEPLKKVVKTSIKHGQVFRSTGGISQVSPGGGSPGESSSGGSSGGGEPVL